MEDLPDGLADVVEPLREAEEYQRVQEIRQRGLYNLVTGAPMFFWVFPSIVLMVALAAANKGNWHNLPTMTSNVIVTILQWTLFALSCFPRTFLPLVRRFRPDWQSPLIEANLLKKSLEKQFWLQLPFYLAYMVIAPVTVILLGNTGQGSHDFDAIRNSFLAVHVVTLFAMCLTLGIRARMLGDSTLGWAYLAWLPIGLVAVFIDSTQTPGLLAMAVFSFALTLPSMLVGLARLLAPRRWLLH